MTTNTKKLGGRLPLLDPLTLSAAQKEIYDRINATFVSWSDRINFQSATDDGRLIGPFNPILFSPGISASFLDLHDAEEKHTSLSERVRQVVILATGAVWQSEYELYAHSAAARKAGISENAIQILAAGGLRTTSASRKRSLSATHANFQPSTVLTRIYTALPCTPSAKRE